MASSRSASRFAPPRRILPRRGRGAAPSAPSGCRSASRSCSFPSSTRRPARARATNCTTYRASPDPRRQRGCDGRQDVESPSRPTSSRTVTTARAPPVRAGRLSSARWASGRRSACSSHRPTTTRHAPVMVLSYDYSAHHFRHDPRIVGAVVHLGDQPYDVISVARRTSSAPTSLVPEPVHPRTMNADLRLEAERLVVTAIWAGAEQHRPGRFRPGAATDRNSGAAEELLVRYAARDDQPFLAQQIALAQQAPASRHDADASRRAPDHPSGRSWCCRSS